MYSASQISKIIQKIISKARRELELAQESDTAEEIKASFEPFYGETSLTGDMNLNAVYDLRRKIDQFTLFSTNDVDAFSKVMNENGEKKKQDATIIGKITSILKPVVDRYSDLEKEKRFLARDTMMKFTRAYAFVTQLVRIEDKDLFKDYLFVSHLVHLLPKSEDERIDISDKIQLEYANLKETYHGAIKLEEGIGAFTAGQAPKPSAKEKKVDTLDRIIDKVNKEYEGEFSPTDKVALENVFKMMMNDKVVKDRLKDFAKTNDANMFIKSIFPKEFQRVLVECYMQSDEAYQRLMNNALFQNAVMNIMAKELYKSLSMETQESKEDK